MGFLWFLLFLLPVLNLFLMINRAVLEHWLYIPAMGFVLFIFALPGDLRWRASKVWFYALPLVLSLSYLTFRQNSIWKDEIVLFENAEKHVKTDPQIYQNLGIAYAEAGRYSEAEKAFDRALAIDPGNEAVISDRKMLINLEKTPLSFKNGLPHLEPHR